MRHIEERLETFYNQNMLWPFQRVKPKDNQVILRKLYVLPPIPHTNETLTIFYGIYLVKNNVKIGECDLRVGMNEELYYAGNIGYRIYEGYRGHHYAYQACLQLFEIAQRQYHMSTLIITCTPTNIASKKTLEKLHGTLLETVDVPKNHWLYERGERIKDIYCYKF